MSSDAEWFKQRRHKNKLPGDLNVGERQNNRSSFALTGNKEPIFISTNLLDLFIAINLLFW